MRPHTKPLQFSYGNCVTGLSVSILGQSVEGLAPFEVRKRVEK